MNFTEAIEALSSGQKVRKVEWPKHEFVHIEGGVFKSNNPNRMNDHFTSIDEYELFNSFVKTPGIVFHINCKFVFFSYEGSEECKRRDSLGWKRIKQ